MAKNDNLKDFLTDVADAIREKKGTTDLINPQDFSAEIASIQSCGEQIQPFYIVVHTETTISFDGGVVQYSLDGKSWVELDKSINTPTIQQGERVYFRAYGLTPNETSGIGHFIVANNVTFDIGGNIMSLLLNADTQSDATIPNNAFRTLFANTKVIDAGELLILAEEIKDYACREMFSGCALLTVAPHLPSKTVSYMGYSRMFENCANLAAAPDISAVNLGNYCFQNMFNGCSELAVAPSILPATTLSKGCYSYMFSNCSKLIDAPRLPAKDVVASCYMAMFQKCFSLTVAPRLSAKILVDGCYKSMFNQCSNLKYVEADFITEPNVTYTDYWLYGVAEIGIFVKASDASWELQGVNGIPESWSVVIK